MTKCMIWRHLYIDREFLLGSWVRDNLFFRFSLLQDIFCRAGPSCNFLRLLLLLSWTDLFLCCSNHSLARENSCCCLPTCSIRNSHLFHLILGTYGLHSCSSIVNIFCSTFISWCLYFYFHPSHRNTLYLSLTHHLSLKQTHTLTWTFNSCWLFSKKLDRFSKQI